MRTVNLEKWRGKRDPVALDPAATPFKAVAARRKCKGCLFDGQWSPVCQHATALAVRAGIDDCDRGFIYIAVELDPRQLTIFNDQGD